MEGLKQFTLHTTCKREPKSTLEIILHKYVKRYCLKFAALKANEIHVGAPLFKLMNTLCFIQINRLDEQI